MSSTHSGRFALSKCSLKKTLSDSGPWLKPSMDARLKEPPRWDFSKVLDICKSKSKISLENTP